MSLHSAPPARRALPRWALIAIMAALVLLLAAVLVWGGRRGQQVLLQSGHTLETTRLRQPGGRSITWAQVFQTQGPLPTALRCSVDAHCSPWLAAQWHRGFPEQEVFGSVALLILSAMVTSRALTRPERAKNPGQAKWASRSDPGIEAITDRYENGSNRRSRRPRRAWRDDPRGLYVGHLIPWREGELRHDYRDTSAALFPVSVRYENVLVMGAPGSGKTRTIFRPNILMDLYAGRTAVVVDFKFPQTDSSFYDLVGAARALSRPTYLFTPFSERSMRLPLLSTITNMDEALSFARCVVAPPEFAPEAGAYFKDNERATLAAFALSVATGPVPSMKELQRLSFMTKAELEQWIGAQTIPEVRQALRGVTEMRDHEIRGMLNGIRNRLQIFGNPNVSRATTAEPGEDIDLVEVFRQGGLLYIGIEQEYMQDGVGEVLLQLIKRRLDLAILQAVKPMKGARLEIPATLYLDELANLGRLPYLMTSLSSMRSRNVGTMIGLQNTEQGKVVYGRDYWAALSTNNIGTRIVFLWGTEGEGQDELSRRLGEMTVQEKTRTASKHPWFSAPWSQERRQGETEKLSTRPLLTIEEIQRHAPNHAVVFAKGLNPALVATTALEYPTEDLRDKDGQYHEIPNALYRLWQPLERYDLARLAVEATQDQQVHLTPGQVSHPAESAEDRFRGWVRDLARLGVQARMQDNDRKLKVMLRKDSLPTEQAQLTDYLKMQGWLGDSQDGAELTITQEGIRVLGDALQHDLHLIVAAGAALHWAREHAAEVEGLSASGEVSGVYTAETLAIPREVALAIYRVVPDLPRLRRGHRELVVLPLQQPDELEAGVRRALDQEQQRKATQAKVPSPAKAEGDAVQPNAQPAPQHVAPAGPSEKKPTVVPDAPQGPAAANATPTQAAPSGDAATPARRGRPAKTQQESENRAARPPGRPRRDGPSTGLDLQPQTPPDTDHPAATPLPHLNDRWLQQLDEENP
ncbi:type IV secretory system conjugative DNA transfer family protein [Deinococcus sonorensis]|uniref:Type IV secretory system conjugative DNA transfer family protein n=1 Tax=Deinococcus sonorensis TaxID=309891 RepID=A0ABV8YAL9_9DEIO